MAVARLEGGPLDGQVIPLEDDTLDTYIAPYGEGQLVYEREGAPENTGDDDGPTEVTFRFQETTEDIDPDPDGRDEVTAAANQPRSSLEIERKYDAASGVGLPDWTVLPGVAAVAEPEVRELDARYFDTEDGALARSGAALRRRVGGPDEGWHVKRRAARGKEEHAWPLSLGPGPEIPAPIAEFLAPVTTEPLAPLARIQNHRTAYALRSAAGEDLAEVVDDHVTGTDLRRGTETRWREWEVELRPAGPRSDADIAAFFDACDRAVRAAGGEVATAESKLGRALGA